MKTLISLRLVGLPVFLTKAGWIACALAILTVTSARADLLAHWTFDEASGTVAHDSAGSGLNGTLSPSGAGFVSGGISSNAISINGAANGFVSVGNVLSLTAGDFSIVAWIKMNPGDTMPDTQVVGKHEGGSVNGYLLMVNQGGGGGQDNKAVFYAGGLVVDGPVSQTSVNDGSWHQVVGVYQFGVNKVLYVDGVAQATNVAPAINGNNAAFLIGGAQNSGVPVSRFTGLIDDVQVYNHALNSTNVLFLFQNPGQALSNPPPRVEPVAHWTFDETGGTVVHDSAGGFDGTLSASGAGFVPGGISSNAVSLNQAANGFVNMGNVLPFTSGDFSLVSWMKMNPGDTTSDTMILGKHEGGSVNGYLLMVNQAGGAGQNNKAVFYAGGLVADGPVSQTSVNDGNWHQVVGVYKSGVNKVIYVDGVAQATNIAPAINGNAAPFLIGGGQAGVPVGRFTGWVDEVQVYNYALTPNDVLYLFYSPSLTLPAIFSIVSHPTNQAVVVGSTAVLNVVAVGPSPLTYQWKFHGTNLPGATSTSLVLPNVQFADAGPYSVVVSDGQGSLASSNAVLTVNPPPPPSITSQPTNQTVALGGTASFHVIATGTQLSYQWLFNGSPFADMTNSSLVLTGVTTNQAGSYTVLVTNPAGSVLSSNAVLVVRDLGPHFFDDFDPEIDTMQWTGFGGTVRATNYGGFVSASNSLWFGGSGSRFAATRPLNTSNGASIQFYLRLGSFVPSSLWDRPELPNDGVVLEYSTNNSVNWVQLGRYDTTNYFNWTSVSVVIPPLAQATNTQFRWRQLANSGPNSDHWALDDVLITTGPVVPFITSQPQNQTVTVGGSVIFNVSAAGTLPLSYQWRFNETNVIAEATGSSLQLTNVQLAAAGTYSAVVSNAAGSTISSNATLTVNLPPAAVTLTSLSAEAGVNVSLPVMLTANGNENAVSFSLNFDTALLSYAGVTLGSGASTGSLLVNTNQIGNGKLGIALALPTDATFSAGPNELVRAGFTTAIGTNAAVANVSFGDVPISRLVSGTAGNVLASTFTGGTVSIAAANYEGDTTPRPDGDRIANITDWVLEGRYAARLDYPTNAAEFQRADCAPRSTLGDGTITVTDWVQAGRYAAALDPLTPVGGPSSEAGGSPAGNGPVQAAGGDREVSVTNGMLLPSQTAAVGVQLKAQGDENALGFSVSYDPAKLTYAGATLGSGAVGATLNVNASQTGTGKLGIVMALGTGNSFAAGTHEVVKLNFTAATTATCDALIALTDQPVPRQVSNPGASPLSASYVSGTISVNPLPALGIALTNNTVRLSWPLWASNFTLQQASETLSPSSWTNLAVTVGSGNGVNEVTLPLGTGDRFYRLNRQ